MRKSLCLLIGSAAFAGLHWLPAAAQETGGSPTIAELEARIRRLEQILQSNGISLEPDSEAPAAASPPLDARVQELEAGLAAERERQAALQARVAAIAEADAQAAWTFAYNRPTIRSADNAFEMALRGRFQFDSGAFFQDRMLPASVTLGRDLRNGANFRRAQIGIQGHVYHDFDYEFVFDFGSSGTERAGQIYLLRLAYTGIPNFTINAGAIQPKFTMDDSTSSADITFMERSSIVNAILDPFGGSDSRRGVEVLYQRQGVFSGADNLLVSTAFTGRRIAEAKSDDEGTQILGRLAYRFFSDTRSNYQVGFNAARILNDPSDTISVHDRPESRLDGTRLAGFGSTGLPAPVGADSGWLTGVEAGMNHGPLTVQGEYFRYGLERTDPALKDPVFGGWYVQASYFLTGETRPYLPGAAAFGTPAIAAPFSPQDNSWGSWEIKARFSRNDFNAHIFDPVPANRVRGGEQNIFSVGLNWYLNRNVRWMFDYLAVDIDRLDDAGLQAGQDFSIFANRLQFSF